MAATSAVRLQNVRRIEPECDEPFDLRCPITKCMFRIPFKLIESGHTYERDAIYTHLVKSSNDPLTRKPVHKNPVLDLETHASVESWLLANPDVVPDGWDDRQIPSVATLKAIAYARDGDTQGLLSCVKQGANLDERDEGGRTSILLAANAGHYDVVQILISYGADLTLCDKSGASLTYICAREGDSRILKLLLENGCTCDEEAKDHHGWTCLHEASEQGHVEVIKLLLKNGSKVEAKDDQGDTVLHTAVKSSSEVYKILLDSTNDVDATDVVGRTALHFAAMYGKVDHVKLLVDSGAKINLLDIDSYTALHLAISEGKLEVVREFLSSAAKVKSEHRAFSLVHCVSIGVDHDRVDTVNLILARTLEVIGVDLNEHAYHRSAELGHESMIKMLLDRGVSIGCLHKLSGATALHSAARHGHVHIAKYLLEMGIDVNVVDCSLKTALQIASDNGESRVQRLIEGYATRARARGRV